MKLIPITYHNKKYPDSIKSDIDEIAGNLDKSKIKVDRTYSLHTEYSHMKRNLDNELLNKYPILKQSNKDNIPQLWKNKEWAKSFAEFIIEMVRDNIPPEIIEIHPPFDDYCSSFTEFFEVYEVFEKIIKKEYPNVKIFIENRCGTFYKGGKFIISKCKTIIDFLQELESRNLQLKLVLDYPQVFSAEAIKMDDIKLKKIIEFNKKLKPYIKYVGGFHLWGKRKSSTGRWTSHTGDLNTFFSGNNLLKEEFIKSIIDTFNDEIVRYFVPEVNSSEEDLQSIVYDLLKFNINFTIDE